MAEPGTLKPPLTIYRGDTYEKKILIGTRDSEGEVVGVNLTLYGDQWLCELRKSEDDTVVVSFRVDTTEATTGNITISLTSTQTLSLPKAGVWDLQVSDTGVSPPKVRTFVKGTFIFDKDVSHV